MKECRHAKTYQGKRPPRCNDGQPCDKCVAKWEATVEKQTRKSAIVKLALREQAAQLGL